MCGIGLCVKIWGAGPSKECAAGLSGETVELLSRRGPEGCQLEEVKLAGVAQFALLSTVLGLRGRQLTLQPVKDELGNLLAWNGEIFGGLKVSDKECDTSFLLNQLSRCSSESELLNIISCIEGPWAFVYFKRNEQQIWFGRDIFGRRSLLYQVKGGSLSLVSAVAPKPNESWTELAASGIYCLDLNGSAALGGSRLTVRFFPWSRLPTGQPFEMAEWRPSTLGESLACSIEPWLSSHLNRELGDGPPPMPAMGRLFFRKVLSEHAEIASSVAELDRVLLEAVRRRLCNHNLVCRLCIAKHRSRPADAPECNHPSVAILFSGGLDSMVIAAFCARLLPKRRPIDLLNVSFQHQVHMIDSRTKTKRWFTSFDAPDRLSAKLGLDELRSVFPDRPWNLVEIDVSKEELQFERANHIRKLIYPLDTVLDDSLGCALWFAARGKGRVSGSSSSTPSTAPYESPARIVFLGMGADEQLGGYSRHMMKYKNHGWPGLVDEISMELNRIAHRNLGRDDRIVSDHGREGRFPFLDRDVVNFLNQVPIWMKVNPHLPRGIGDKMLLRTLAASLGLSEAACRPKRAMQFGSRVVHAEEDRAKGGDICKKLMDLDLVSVPDSERAYWKS